MKSQDYRHLNITYHIRCFKSPLLSATSKCYYKCYCLYGVVESDCFRSQRLRAELFPDASEEQQTPVPTPSHTSPTTPVTTTLQTLGEPTPVSHNTMENIAHYQVRLLLEESLPGHTPALYWSCTGLLLDIHRSFTGHTSVFHWSCTGLLLVMHRSFSLTGHKPVF